ncbi:MAG TPA: ADYC domain-containing protein [Kofleriaceae bacterium]|jgi:hypothetical protein
MMMSCAAGQGAVEDPPGAVDPPKLQVTTYGEEEQGRFVLGNLADGLASGGRHVSVTAPTGTTISVDGQRLVFQGVPAPIGLVLPASGADVGALRIDDIDPGGAGYLVRYWNTTQGAWLDYCDPAESPWALAMPGEWTTAGLHDAGPMVTFACQISGKAAKCEAFGYRPETTAGAGPGLLGWDLNQACVQLTRADYCGDGESHTREKTPILIRDFIPGAEPNNVGPYRLQDTPASYPPVPPPPDQYYYEAAWAPRMPVLCLNRMRWADFELGGPCPRRLKDPRVDPSAKFCEELVLDQNPRYLLDACKTMDLALHRWSNGAGDTVTTVHGYVVDETTTRRHTVPPVGFRAPALMGSEGYLLRNQTGELKEPDTVFKVYRLHNATTGDSVVGPPGMLPGYSFTDPDDFEGYLVKDAGPDYLPLYLYQAGDDYVTAVDVPGLFFHKVGGLKAPPIGYVIAGSL